jgi:membrane protein DedA with SNARE-associated domain
MPVRTFFPWNACGGITWAVFYGLLGYYGGQAVVNVAESVGIVAAIVLAVAIVGGLLLSRVRDRRSRRRAVEMLSAQDPPVVQRDPTPAGGPAGPPAA